MTPDLLKDLGMSYQGKVIYKQLWRLDGAFPHCCFNPSLPNASLEQGAALWFAQRDPPIMVAKARGTLPLQGCLYSSTSTVLLTECSWVDVVWLQRCVGRKKIHVMDILKDILNSQWFSWDV